MLVGCFQVKVRSDISEEWYMEVRWVTVEVPSPSRPKSTYTNGR